MFNKIVEASKYLIEKIKILPECVVFLNHESKKILEDLLIPKTISFDEIPGFVGSIDKNFNSKLHYGILSNHYVFLVEDAPFLYEGISNVDYAFIYRVFAHMGIRYAVLTSICISINESFNEGEFILVKDHITFNHPNLLRGKNFDRLGPRRIDSSNIYNEEARFSILKSENLKEGILTFYEGPEYPSPATINTLKILGVDIISPRIVPEAILCHQCSMNIVALCLVTNKIDPKKSRPITERSSSLLQQKNDVLYSNLIQNIIKLLPKNNL